LSRICCHEWEGHRAMGISHARRAISVRFDDPKLLKRFRQHRRSSRARVRAESASRRRTGTDADSRHRLTAGLHRARTRHLIWVQPTMRACAIPTKATEPQRTAAIRVISINRGHLDPPWVRAVGHTAAEAGRRCTRYSAVACRPYGSPRCAPHVSRPGRGRPGLAPGAAADSRWVAGGGEVS
jgi:hypothetical protein